MSLNDSLRNAVEAGKRDAVERATKQLQSDLAAANKRITELETELEDCRNGLLNTAMERIAELERVLDALIKASANFRLHIKYASGKNDFEMPKEYEEVCGECLLDARKALDTDCNHSADATKKVQRSVE